MAGLCYWLNTAICPQGSAPWARDCFSHNIALPPMLYLLYIKFNYSHIRTLLLICHANFKLPNSIAIPYYSIEIDFNLLITFS